MGLIYTIVLAILVMISTTNAAFPVPKGAVENFDSSGTDGGRKLRHIVKQDFDDSEMGEERTLDLKKVVSKVNPVTAVKKVIHNEKISKSAASLVKHEKWLAKMRETIGNGQ
ncbi:Avirulence protein [Phytophthora megakarya]|uniref:Avirulence protein n=1 Tax=Phytophthora megakarya TaxID=4795 RepID=A0A225V0Z7_9STRA|nr:Avirulence protein [Phytophthora megakarya]